MRIIVGLGNPGRSYERTRHNAGFRAVRAFAERHGVREADWKSKFEALTAEVRVGTEKILLMLPQTYMNESGKSAGAAATFYKVAPEHVLTAYDDIDVMLGKLRIRADGSAGGHNGVKSLIAHLGTQAFPRIRIGVGGEHSRDIPSEDWVLGKFTPDEDAALKEVLERAADVMDAWIAEGLTAAQNKFSA